MTRKQQSERPLENDLLLRVLKEEVSEERMMRLIEELSDFHRLQASKGYREAAALVLARLRERGISAELRSYPAEYGKRVLTQKTFEEWNCEGAWCRLSYPEDRLIADASVDVLSIFQKSYPCRFEDEELDVVLMDRGNDERAYEGLDIKGKLLFVRDDFNAYLDWAVRKRGAVGFISDYVVENEGARTRDDQQNVRKYTTYWWTEEEASRPFGFVMTPEEGEQLAALCLETAAARTRDPELPAYPRVRCRIDAEFKKGSFENATAFLPGEKQEEIWLLAHLCHPKPSANDNLSGVAAATEALGILKDLIARGELPPLKRGIRLWLVPEFTGTFALLDEMKDVSHAKACLNLDMVGGKQELGYGPLTLSGVPDSLPSIAGAMASILFRELRREVPAFTDEYAVPLFNGVECGFVAGSDNFILSDPSIGIPAPMLSQWPDKFYHTGGDKPGMISSPLLLRVAAFAAAYAYSLANLSLDNAEKIASELLSRLFLRLREFEDDADLTEERRDRLAARCADACKDSIAMLPICFDGEERRDCEILTERTRRMAERIGALRETHSVDRKPACGESFIPVRTYRGPVNSADDFADTQKKKELIKYYRKHFAWRLKDAAFAELLTQYATDGKRNAEEIADTVALNCAHADVEAIAAYLDLLVELGLCRRKDC
ncbi:MAG: DUF4910 domain-containing protein [Clostridiales Family XIII bacterium]|jgi:hypothetical protein|nr:DUF4910 domain-containing protein [Clostridiales Family XIII bacterium]